MIEYIVKMALGVPQRGIMDRTLRALDESPAKMYSLLTRPLADYIAKKALGIN